MEKYNKSLCSSEVNVKIYNKNLKVACVKTKQSTALLDIFQNDIPSLNTQVCPSVHVLQCNKENIHLQKKKK